MRTSVTVQLSELLRIFSSGKYKESKFSCRFVNEPFFILCYINVSGHQQNIGNTVHMAIYCDRCLCIDVFHFLFHNFTIKIAELFKLLYAEDNGKRKDSHNR